MDTVAAGQGHGFDEVRGDELMNYYIFHVDSYMYIVSPRIRPILYFQKKCMRGTPPSKQGQEVGYEDFK